MKKSIFLILVASIFISLPMKLLMAATGDVYRVTGVAPGEGLVMYREANTKGPTVIKIPHNASWVIKRPESRPGWQRISWNDQHGWVEAGKLSFDRAATQVVADRNQCLKDPTVTNKICCGFPPGAESEIFKTVKVHSVTGIRKGQSLKMYAQPALGTRVIVSIPHNGTWIVKINKTAHKDGINWEKISWGGNRGWVNALNLQFNPELTTAGDLKRKQCSTPAGCAPDFSALEKKK